MTGFDFRHCSLVGLAGALVLSVLALAAYWYIYAVNQTEAYDQAQLGMRLEQVIELTGQPRYTTDGSRWVEPQYSRAAPDETPGCSHELWYQAWASLFPLKWSYCFNSSGELIHKYHWASW
jgi:hypothetical protein